MFNLLKPFKLNVLMEQFRCKECKEDFIAESEIWIIDKKCLCPKCVIQLDTEAIEKWCNR